MQTTFLGNPQMTIGLLWRGQVFTYMEKLLEGFPEKKLISLRMIDSLNRSYMSAIARGLKHADVIYAKGDIIKWDKPTYKLSKHIAEEIRVSQLFVLNYFIAIYNLAKAGKIPYQKWNPRGYIKAKKLMKKIPTEIPMLEKVGKKAMFAGMAILPIAIIGALAAGYIMLKR